MKTRYGTARSIISFVGIIGWIGFSIGILIFVFGLTQQSMATPMLIGAGLMTVVSSLVLVAIASVAVAVLDTGDNTAQSAIILRALAENQGVDLKTNPSKITVPADELQKNPSASAMLLKGKIDEIEYMGETITKAGNRFSWKGDDFLTLGKVKAAIKSEKANAA